MSRGGGGAGGLGGAGRRRCPGGGVAAAGTAAGVVVEQRTRKPVPGAIVTIEGVAATAHANEAGEYRLTGLPPGTYVIACEAPGYRREAKPAVAIRSGETSEIAFALVSVPPRFEELVEVVAPLPRRGADLPVGGITLSGRQLAVGSGAMGDFGRYLRAAAAAGGVSDERNTIIARGGNPIENGFFVDNVEVPAISHLPDFGSTGGIYSLIDPEMVRDFDFIVGGFPVEHGQHLSSITEIRYREGSRDRLSGGVRYDVAMGAAGAEGPLPGKRGSWLASVRRADFVLLTDMIGWDASPQWTDAHVKLVYDLSPRHTLSLLDLYSGDRLTEAHGFWDETTEYHRLSQHTIGVNWLASWSGRIRSETSVSHSRSTWRHGYTYSPPEDVYDWYDKRKTEWLALRNRNSLTLGGSHRLEFGLQTKRASQSFTDYRIKDPNAPGGRIMEPTAWTYETTEPAAFAAATTKLPGRLTATAGAGAPGAASPPLAPPGRFTFIAAARAP